MRRFFSAFLLRLPRGVAAGALCAVLVALLAQFGWLDPLQSGALDRLFQARGARSPDPRITIVVADDATVARMGQWPLPRGLYGRVIERLSRAGARTIACDVLFSVPSYSSAQDALLARSCRESGRVVQAAAFHVPLIYNPVVPVTLQSDRRPLPARFAVKDLGAPSRSASWASSALPALQKSAVAVGHVNVHPELDGTLRRVPHLIRYRERTYPSLSLAATAHFLGLSSDDIIGDTDAVRLAPRGQIERRMPLDANGEAWINWAGGNGTFPTYNFNQLLDGQVPPEALQNRLILVGITAAGAFEYRSTPFSPVQPAIELQANAISDLLLNRPLREAGIALQGALLLAFSLLTGVLSAPRRVLGATLWLGFLLAVLWLASVGAMALDFYVPPVAPALGALLTYAVTIAGNYRREWETNWRTDASVAALARGGALMASGRERERLLAVIGATAREVLQAREVFVVIENDPDLCPAPAQATLREAARRIAAGGGVILWSQNMAGEVHPPAPATDDATLLPPALPDPVLRGVLEQLCIEIGVASAPGGASRGALDSVVAAPFAGAADEEKPPVEGVLMALGRRDGQAFTPRDAILLQTLAKQASLALDNLGYYERLQGRVELANRKLRDAYDVLSGERASLFQERAKLAAAVESMESALVISDENHCAVFDNGMGSGLLWNGVPVIGQSVPAMLSGHQLPELAALFEQIEIKDGAAPQKATLETTQFIERGPAVPPQRRVLAAQLTPLVAGDGNRLGSMLVVSDVTAERELEAMKSDFVSFVAHELRTPLTSINGFATLLKLNALQIAPDDQAEMLDSIGEQCERLNRMIGDLLEVARLEPSHGIQVHPQPFDLAALCRKVLDRLRVVIPDSQKLTLQMRDDGAPLPVELDPDRMEQVLLNLLSNAIKYSPDGGAVTLDLSTCGENVRLQVSDTGMGMTPEQVAQLFQKYYRTPEAQTRGITGTGLGLYLVKHLTQAHGGSIEVSSEVGRGTSFLLTLPRSISCGQYRIAADERAG